MKKFYSIIFICLVFSSYGQSKKELIATVERMKNDSTYTYLEIVNIKNKLDAKNKELKNKNDEILELIKKIDKIELALINGNKSNDILNNKNKILQEKNDSLIKELKLEQENIAKTSYVDWSYGEETKSLEPLDIQNEFDFQYIYHNGNGFNPPVIYPIGWSYDGKIAYKEDYCNGGCGCCSSSIIVKDLNSNRIIKNQNTNIDNESLDNSIWSDYNYRNSVIETVSNYNIIPFGFGDYNTSKFIKKNEYDNSSIEIILEVNNGKYELKTKKNGYSAKLEYRGNLDYDEDFEYWYDVDYAGYFINEFNNYVAIALMHESRGFEGENDYDVELIGIKLP